ncbi:Panacea domain-containing protein [Sphingomonas molluscorum]|uniref:Panacea domain-containing protein n=1 Tax=Sphingomonas TaxID=13687 RepID=UPI00195F4925
MVYLADWLSLINGKPSVSSIDWYFDNYGPFVWDIKRCVENSDTLNLRRTSTVFGNKKEVVELNNDNYTPVVDNDTKWAIDHIISETKKLNWADFIRLVYSTYPVASSQKYTVLDLPTLAQEYVASPQK